MPPITIEDLTTEDEALRELVEAPSVADGALPQGDLEAYDEAQQSVVDARRKAELHDGLLQVN